LTRLSPALKLRAMPSWRNWLLLALAVLVGLVLAGLYLGWFASPPAPQGGGCPPPLEVCELARVIRVVDGDTVIVWLKSEGRKERVRLIGVDTPEVSHPYKPIECYGPEASRFAKRTLDHRWVWLSFDSRGDRRDKYDRLLAYLWLDLDGDKEDVELFNEELIVRGYARVYPFFPFDYLERFRRDEEKARAARRGLWGACGYQPYGG